MLCVLGFDGYFKRLNPAWERTLGFSVDELKARPFIDFVHPDDRGRTLGQNETVRGGGQARSFENRYVCKDGSFRWLLWNATPDESQGLIYSVARDITARKAAEAEREQLIAEVRSLQEILPICSYCHKVRSDTNYWLTVEQYFSRHTNTLLSHSICPECVKTVIEPQFGKIDEEPD